MFSFIVCDIVSNLISLRDITYSCLPSLEVNCTFIVKNKNFSAIKALHELLRYFLAILFRKHSELMLKKRNVITIGCNIHSLLIKLLNCSFIPFRDVASLSANSFSSDRKYEIEALGRIFLTPQGNFYTLLFLRRVGPCNGAL